ncbi:hypothetical protein HDU87_003754 [Geranomyces variabilis]|uniref:BZIP domain-containing protein n=1 Tax=Geranomyces variabilis TaxID=109894 RepID=A0AAD5TPJ7_9FUNG|nr:hypothetical protein HDU87_003754 [Geranomyces variabilis]
MTAATQSAESTPPPQPPRSDVSSSPGSSARTPPPPAGEVVDDELFRSFINDDFLAMADLDDYGHLPYAFPLDDHFLSADPLAPLTDAEMMQGVESLQSSWALIGGPESSSPESSISGLRAFSPSSPSSAASIRSPSTEWLLDFDDPLKMTPLTIAPPGPAVVVPELSMKAPSLSAPVPPPAGGQQWKFVNCSVPNGAAPPQQQQQQQQEEPHAQSNSTAAPLASQPPTSAAAKTSAAALAGVVPQHQQQPLVYSKPPLSPEPLLKIKSEPQSDTESQKQPQQNATAAPIVSYPLSAVSTATPLASTPLPFVPTAKATIQQLLEMKKQPLLPPKPPADPSAPLTPAQKRAERLIRNRAAALESRKRKREHQTRLEEQTENLLAENTMLMDRLKQLEDRNIVLERENAVLRQSVHCTCGQSMAFNGNMFGAQPLPAPASKPQHHVELPDKKTVGTVLMTVFFSFALIFLPGFMSSSSHLGGHIVGRAYSASNSESPLLSSEPASVFPQATTGFHLLDAPQQILYLPASASPLAGGPSTSRGGVVPVMRTDISRRVKSAVALPLDWRFGDVLGGLASRVEKTGRGPVTKLRDLFRNTKDDVTEHITPAATAAPTPRRGGIVARQLLRNAARDHSNMPPGAVREFVRIPADHATQYNADGSAPKAIPHISLDDSIHLLPYQAQDPAPAVASPPRAADPAAEACARPKFSLIATLPPADVRDDDKGAFLQLDVEVVGARMVTWNASEDLR